MAGLNLSWLIGLSSALSQTALSSRGFGRIKRWWMPPPSFWTALSWRQQKAGKAKKKKGRDWFTDLAGKSSRADECYSHYLSVCLFASLFPPMMFGRKVHLREITAIIITANHEISRLAINPNSALIIVSSLLIFSSLISLFGQYVISSPLSQPPLFTAAISHLRTLKF